MPRIMLNFDKPYRATFLRLAALAVLVVGCFLTPSLAQQPGQKTFSSPEDASSALVAATQSNDEKAMLDILGPDGKQIVSSGDDAEDAQSRANFVEKYGRNAPSGERTGRNYGSVYRSEKLAHSHTAHGKRRLVVFRH